MLRISKKADYAVFLLGAIARQGAFPGGRAEDTVVSAHEIARQARLNKSVVANLLKEFTRHGLLESVRGLRGGYRLTRSPSDVSLGEILEVVEGRFVLVDCIEHEAVEHEAVEHEAAGRPAAAGHGGAARGTSGASTRSGSSGLLPQAASMTTKVLDADAQHDCALIAFCPSKQPMRLVHQRISKLFHEIRLAELCSLASCTT